MTSKTKTRVQQVPADIIERIIDGTMALDEEKALSTIKRVAKVTYVLFKTTVVGAENVPEETSLFICNHSTMAMDVSVALPALTHAAGRFIRCMNDELFYRNESVRYVLVDNIGAVMAHPDVGDAMFEANKDLLLFPGGAHEANKDLDKRYTLQWKQRTGFVRMAAKHGVPIVPVGIVGPDEWYGRYMDRDEVANSWVGDIYRRLGASEEHMQSDQLFPIPKGLFGGLLPRPQRTYLCIGEPISTEKYKGKTLSQKMQNDLRDQAKENLEDCIGKMLLQQSQDRENTGLLRRFMSFY